MEFSQTLLCTTDYDLLDEYYYQLNQDDFDAKWVAIMWPNKLEVQTEKTYERLDEQEKEFEKIQQADQNQLGEQIESISRAVLSFSAHNDIEKVQEVYKEVKRIVKDLADCDQMAMLYNNRERIFGKELTNYTKIQKLQKDFERYKNLWSQCFEFNNSYNSWFVDPLIKIDPEALEALVSESHRTFHKACKVFADVEQVRQVGELMKQKVENFKPYVPLIQGLRNPGMRVRHWESLSDKLGFQIAASKDLTFQKCLDRKLDEHIDTIASVAEVAGKEYSIESALDSMRSGLEKVFVVIKTEIWIMNHNYHKKWMMIHNYDEL